MKRWMLAWQLLAVLLLGCASDDTSENRKTVLTVFAAASLTDSFTQIGRDFEAANPTVEVRLNFGGSSQLAAQINNGAPADVFASANIAQMQVAAAAGNVEGEPRLFATNSLVVIVSTASNIEINELADLQLSGVQFITTVEGVPIRDYTNQTLASLSAPDVYGEGFASAVFNNVVSEENNVRQVVIKVSLGEADAGIVYASDVTPDIQDSVRVIPIPDEHNVLATYPIAVLSQSREKTTAQQFVDFVLAADETLLQWGFQPVE